MTTTTNKQIEDDVNEAAKKGSNTVENLKEKAGDVYNEARKTAVETQETIIKYVKENPLKSVGWAALAGALLGALLRK